MIETLLAKLGAQVRSLVKELRSHMPYGVAKQNKEKLIALEGSKAVSVLAYLGLDMKRLSPSESKSMAV